MFSFRFSGSKILINLRRQFRVRKIFFVYVKLSVHKFFRDLRSFRFMFKITIPKVCDLCSRLATSITWTRTLDPDPGPWIRTLKTWPLKNLDPEKPRPRKTWTLKNWTLKNLDSEKPGLWKMRETVGRRKTF